MEMEQWARVRRKILIEKRNKRFVMKEEDLHWEILQEILAHSIHLPISVPEQQNKLNRENALPLS